MLSIGELARRTRVSVRMLRHYDALGLVEPQRVDPETGYRWYAPSQIGRVDTLVALKELGFSLDECRALLDERISADRLSGMLRLRRDELERRVQADTRRLAEVERRLRSIEEGLRMTHGTLRLEPLPALRLAQVSGEVNDTSEIAALHRELLARLNPSDGRVVSTYNGGSKIEVAVGVPLAPGQDPPDGLHLAELPAVERGAVLTRRPSTDDPWLTVDAVLHERGLESHGPYREVTDGDLVELQCPVRPARRRPSSGAS
ncbi:MerR family transcriptional regulator [Spirillospora sp. CA-294931]|uniref:MerR family transcriptional regulator n=1 Tax=Spirillospora sp. CA-294931 TaxID=3240042 RepID=UPI003D8AE60C